MNILYDAFVYPIVIFISSYLLLLFKDYFFYLIPLSVFLRKDHLNNLKNPFILIKTLTIISCLLISNPNDIIFKTAITINIIETFPFDKKFNIIIGIMLIYFLWNDNSIKNENRYLNIQIYLCNISHIWIFVYSIWNCIFIYNRKMNIKTGIILIVPIIYEILIPGSWAIIRCSSLLCNILLCRDSYKFNEFINKYLS